MTKILIATEKPFSKDAVEQMKTLAAENSFEVVLLEKYTDKAQFLDAVKDVECLIIRSDIVDQTVLDAAQNLKIVVRAGAGYDNVDLATAKAKGVVVMNTPGQNSNAVAELAIGMMIYKARALFSGKSGSELKGKKLGLHAYGNVARAVATLAKGFAMDIYAYDPFASKENIEKDGVHYVEKLEDLYASCDYVSLHIPATAETKGSINYALLASLPKNATLVNTARKEVINEADLLKIFAERADFSYVSDIAPDCAAEIAEKYPERFFFTPKKMGAETAEANANAGLAAVRQIANFISKGDVTFQVNK
jgi:D-3-phosphoglycerate dehydrogenase